MRLRGKARQIPTSSKSAGWLSASGRPSRSKLFLRKTSLSVRHVFSSRPQKSPAVRIKPMDKGNRVDNFSIASNTEVKRFESDT